MTLEEQAKKISVFFFFALLDESLAAQASERAASAWKASRDAWASPRSVIEPEPASPSERRERVALIELCRSRFDKELLALRKRGARDRLGSSAPGGPGSPWRLAPDANIAAWIKFSKEASEDERLAMVLARILRFAEDEVAEGLAISIGTLRHRLSRASRALGAVVRKTGAG